MINDVLTEEQIKAQLEIQLYAMVQMILEEMDEEERNNVISKMMAVEEDLQ